MKLVLHENIYSQTVSQRLPNFDRSDSYQIQAEVRLIAFAAAKINNVVATRVGIYSYYFAPEVGLMLIY